MPLCKTIQAATYSILLAFVLQGIIASTSPQNACKPLNQYISCYQIILDFNIKTPHADQPPFVTAHFSAFKRDFEILLVRKDPAESVLSGKVRINRISSNSNRTFLGQEKVAEVTGRLLHEKSQIRGILVAGRVFQGEIHTANETFYVERARRYGLDDRKALLIYRASDITYWSQDFRSARSAWKAKKGPVVPEVPLDIFDGSQPNSRTKRFSVQSSDRRICHMHALADHTFYKSQGLNSDSSTVAEMVKYMTETDEIFRRTDFNGDGSGDNIVFSLDEITLYSDPLAAGYQFADEHLPVDKFLDQFSKYNFDKFCLAIIFVHRDFEDGVIGLAWMGSSSQYGSAGGLCQRRIWYHDPPFYDKGYYSFNTLLVSTLNYGETLPQKVSALTVTHEIGHSFGSPHDDEWSRKCAPNGPYGNFLMHPYSSDADKPNNFEFSPCSKSYINPVVVKKGWCMEAASAGDAFCGNGMVEEGETCDCGDTARCYVDDPCCEPPSAGPEACTFSENKGHHCSPRMSACCSDTCQIHSASDSAVCQPETDCLEASVCDGARLDCPPAVTKPNGRPCNGGQGYCQDGVCNLDVCSKKGLESCQCTNSLRPDELCQVCCLSLNASCVPAHLLDLRDSEGRILQRNPGQSCNGYQGYCDRDRTCVMVDAEAAINRLLAMFSRNTAQKTFEWFANYWYLVLLTLAATVLLVGLFRAYRKVVIDVSDEPLTGLARRSARMALVCQEAQRVADGIRQDLDDLEDKFYEAVTDVYRDRSLDAVEAIARICYFFPTTPRKVVMDTVRISASEEFAVKQLLIRGYSMRALFHDDSDTEASS